MSAIRTVVSSLRSGYRRAFRREDDVRVQEVAYVLRQVAPFRSLPGSALAALAETVHARTYRRDEYVYYEGDPGLGLYIIRQGRVRLLMEDEEGGASELRQLEDLELFGDLSLLGDFRRTETAQAVTEVQVLGLFRPDLNAITKRNPAAAAAITAALAQYQAARQVELLKLLAARLGPADAARLIHAAAVRTTLLAAPPTFSA